MRQYKYLSHQQYLYQLQLLARTLVHPLAEAHISAVLPCCRDNRETINIYNIQY